MGNDVEKFDPSQLMQGVKDRIKAEFVGLIPEEQWQEMVKREVDIFFKERDRGYHSKNHQSDFGQLVHNLLRDEVTERINTYLKGEEFETVWTGPGTATVSKAVKEIIIENSGEMLANMVGGMVSQGIQRAAQNY